MHVNHRVNQVKLKEAAFYFVLFFKKAYFIDALPIEKSDLISFYSLKKIIN